MSAENPTQIHATGEATGFIPAPNDKGKPITVIGTNSIRAGLASEVARLKARFVIKDSDASLRGAA